MLLLELYKEGLLEILSYLNVKELNRFICTNQQTSKLNTTSLWRSLIHRDIACIQTESNHEEWIDKTMRVFQFESYVVLYKAFISYHFPLCSYYSCIAEGIYLPKGILLQIKYSIQHDSCIGYFSTGVILEAFNIYYNKHNTDIYPANRFYTDNGPGYLNRFYLAATKYADHLHFCSKWKPLMQFTHIRIESNLIRIPFHTTSYSLQDVTGSTITITFYIM
jgi:hypothetical protein